jgi:Flp pilus assembly protein TadG
MKSGASSVLARHRRRAAALLGRFGMASGGATAVEFSIVALPFLTLLFAVLELGLVFMVSTSLENAVDDAARQIRTGEFQGAGGTKATFKTLVCNGVTWLSDCSSKLTIDVRTFTDFNATDATPPVDAQGQLIPTAMTVQPGGPVSIVLVRAYYEWSLITPMLNSSLVNAGGGKRLISAAAAFRNEPYE